MAQKTLAFTFVLVFSIIFFNTTGNCSFVVYSYYNYNYVNDMAVDEEFIWCAVMGGVLKINSRNYSYELFTEKDGLIRKDPYTVAVDHDGMKWFGYFLDYGITSFDGDLWKTFDLPSGGIKTIAIDHDNVKWFGGFHGVTSYDGKLWTQFLEDHFIYSIAVDHDNIKWFGTARDIWPSCIWRYDGETWTKYPEGDKWFDDWIYEIAVDDNNTIWARTWSDVFRFDDNKWIQVEKDETTNDTIFNCVRDIDGYIWKGSAGGLFHLNESVWKQFSTGYPTYISRGEIIIDHNNIHWFIPVNTGYAGLKLHYKDGDEIRVFDSYFEFKEITGAVDDNNVKWFGSRLGVMRYDGEMIRYTANDGLIDNYVVAVASGKNNEMWFGTNRGVSCFNGSEWISYTEENGLASNLVRAICVDHDNVKWFGTTAGVSSFDGTSWKTYVEMNGFINRHVYAAAVDHDNVKWFGTRRGVSSFDGTKWLSYTESDGLIFNNINDIVVDMNNTKWFATDRGISCFNGATWKSYTEQEGLPSPFVNSLAVDTENVVWFITDKGEGQIENYRVSVRNVKKLPEAITIFGNYPNPFNLSTKIEFTLPEESFTTLIVYNIMGQKVRTLISDTITAGQQSIIWDSNDDNGNPVSSGIYITQLKSRHHVAIKRMALVK